MSLCGKEVLCVSNPPPTAVPLLVSFEVRRFDAVPIVTSPVYRIGKMEGRGKTPAKSPNTPRRVFSGKESLRCLHGAHRIVVRLKLKT